MNKKESLGLVLSLVLVLLSTSTVHSQSPTYTDIPYVPDGIPWHVLDIYLPETGDGSFPVILEFHGQGLDPAEPTSTLEHVLEQGYAMVAVDYTDNVYQQGEKDSFCALAWLHAYGSEYNLDTNRVVALGFSMGAFMASYLGTVDDPEMFLEDCPHELDKETPLRGVVELSAGGTHIVGPDDKLALHTGFSVTEVPALKESIGDLPPNEWRDTLTGDALAFASWLTTFWVDGSEPPFLLIHGDSDDTIPARDSIFLAELLEAAGSPVELHIIPGMSHPDMYGMYGFTADENGKQITEVIDAFLIDVFDVTEQ